MKVDLPRNCAVYLERGACPVNGQLAATIDVAYLSAKQHAHHILLRTLVCAGVKSSSPWFLHLAESRLSPRSNAWGTGD